MSDETRRRSFYSRVVFPRICRWVMNSPRLNALRADLLAPVEGDILEIGFGTGLNPPHYPPCVRAMTTVDPNPGMTRLASGAIARSKIQVVHRRGQAERLPLKDHSFDFVVSTWTLCSVSDPARVVQEIHRVLRPGGRFLFLEHGLSEDPRVATWQRRQNPLERILADGCRLDLDYTAMLPNSPFLATVIERFLVQGIPRTHGTMYRGSATR